MSLIRLFDHNDPWSEMMWPTIMHSGSSMGDIDRAVRAMERDMRHLERQFAGMQQHYDRHLPTADIHSLFRKHAVQPCIVEEDGQKKVQWKFDVRGFKPEDVQIKTRENTLEVQAKHEDQSDHHRHYREFSRIVCLPEGTQLPQMKSTLTDQGVLTIQAPYTSPAVTQKPPSTEIAIQHE
ncbi:major egg antigen-like [Corticium candelabrum]|uniref:major egg antigen-like n=1 Tax=Corticium candelabrum TaxID=121492 RepID=UPI002E32E5D8|nr:major egg antigen-like [Corticium candelabrum]